MHPHIALARAGTLVFVALLTITLLSVERAPADAATSPARVPGTAARPAGTAATDGVALARVGLALDTLAAPTLSAPAGPMPVAAAVLGVESAPAAVTPAPTAAPAPVAVAPTIPAAPAPAGGGSVVLASWYGPGFYGNRTACGQVYTPQIAGVAHKTLPCGTLLVLSHGGRNVTVAVIDRGPYIAGRTLDLSAATRGALGCPDLCTLLMQFAR